MGMIKKGTFDLYICENCGHSMHIKTYEGSPYYVECKFCKIPCPTFVCKADDVKTIK